MIFVKCDHCGNYLGNRKAIQVDLDGNQLNFCDDECLQNWLIWKTQSQVLTDWIYSRLEDEGDIEDKDWHQANEDVRDEQQLERDLNKQRL